MSSKGFESLLGDRVRTSRLIGSDPALVLHGGGNTSFKCSVADIDGASVDVLFVKGSGWDLATIESQGFSPVRLSSLKQLSKLPSLSDSEMVNQLRINLLDAEAPVPSVEAILHAVLPYTYVDHTHADAILALTNTDNAVERVKEVFGDSVVIIPYVMPGFDLARCVAEEFPRAATSSTLGMVLLNHGLFSFGATAEESYQRTLELVAKAERYLKSSSSPQRSIKSEVSSQPVDPISLAELRRAVSRVAGHPMVLLNFRTPSITEFLGREDLESVALRGPATPDHVLRTKRLPLIGRDVEHYAREYQVYFSEYQPKAKERKQSLDPAPRVVLDRELGLCTIGRSVRDAKIVADIYEHTITIIQAAERLGGYCPLGARDIFDVEYWDLEQAKLRRQPAPAAFAGEIALVTGAASGIGAAAVKSLLARGAAVVGLDKNPIVASMSNRADFIGLCCDLTDANEVERAVIEVVRAFGGIDIAVLNAGIFPHTTKLDVLGLDTWRSAMSINADANLCLMRSLHPYLKRAARAGRLVVVGSKNVPAPGVGAAAYSASKAALTQLARIAALEWGRDGIRVNVIHPDGVFDTAIWTDEVIAARASSHGLSVQDYKTRNVLEVEINSRDVAELIAEVCGQVFDKITGAQIPIDGGSDRII